MKFDLTPAQLRAAVRDAAITNRDTLAWATATLARFPHRHDLRDLIARLSTPHSTEER